MNNIAIAKDTIRITQAGEYQCGGQTVRLPDCDASAVTVITPDMGAKLLETVPDVEKCVPPCSITVTTEDSFSAAQRFEKPLVMNFANAHHAGGGFLLGANAQEEALCRCSTLYASIHSEAAKEMYTYNNTHASCVESDYMLLSPNVCVFRDHKCEPLKTPYTVGVITLPAPNLRGAALFASGKKVEETILRRIRIMLRIAIQHGYRDLVLGAWGCGAFGNDPRIVAGSFRTALTDDGLGIYFRNVCFAVYGSPDSRNYRTFASVFG